MSTLADFVGLPFADHGRTREGADCWGGVRLVLAELRGIVLPDYGDGYDHTGDWRGVSVSIVDGLVRDFERVEQPAPFDLVIFNLAKKPWHVGIVVKATGTFLHWPQPSERGGGTSRVERWHDARWHNRVEGFYRHAN